MYNISINNTQKTVTISDKVFYRNTTIPNLALLVTIVRADTNEEKGRAVTGEDGIYSITIPLLSMPSGTYEIRFYGSNTRPFLTPKGDWVAFSFINPINLETIRFTGTPVLQVSEGVTQLDVNGSEKTGVSLDLTFLGTSTGAISYIEFYYKKSIEDDTAWTILDSFAFSEDLDNVNVFTVSGVQNTEAQFKTYFSLGSKPENYDFYCIFFNPLLQLALESDDVTILRVFDNNVTFNGIPDLQEYVEVTKLEVVNAVDSESGSLPDSWAKLEWENLKELPNTVENFPKFLRNGFDGSIVEVDYKLAQGISAYGVWMYVSDDQTDPPTLSGMETFIPAEFPGWYFMGDYATPNAAIQCPIEKWVGFWVGMKTRGTEILKDGQGLHKESYVE